MSHRWRSYSLRALFAITAVIAIAAARFGFTVHQSLQQATAISRIIELGGRPTVTMPRGRVINGLTPSRHGVFRKLLGENVFVCVPLIDLHDPALSAEAIRSMIPYIRRILPVDGMNEEGKCYVALVARGNPTFDEELIAEIKSQLPNCEFTKCTPVPKEVTTAVHKGMRQQDVVNIVGSLHYEQLTGLSADERPSAKTLGSLYERYTDAEGLESWTYFTDDVGIGLFGIDFDANGIVSRTWTVRGRPKGKTQVGR